MDYLVSRPAVFYEQLWIKYSFGLTQIITSVLLFFYHNFGLRQYFFKVLFRISGTKDRFLQAYKFSLCV